jgi:hypothetical protein
MEDDESYFMWEGIGLRLVLSICAVSHSRRPLSVASRLVVFVLVAGNFTEKHRTMPVLLPVQVFSFSGSKNN